MNNIKILENAYTSVIELAESNNFRDKRELINIYHILKFVRSVAKEYNQEGMITTLDIYSAKFKRYTDRSFQYTMMSANIDGESKRIRLNSPFTNIHGALTLLIRQKLKNKDTKDFLRLYKITKLYIHRLFVYSDMIDSKQIIKFTDAENLLTCFFISDIGYHIGYLENAMRFCRIDFDEIIV